MHPCQVVTSSVTPALAIRVVTAPVCKNKDPARGPLVNRDG
jgi:hypothetical protein